MLLLLFPSTNRGNNLDSNEYSLLFVVNTQKDEVKIVCLNKLLYLGVFLVKF